jgi:beta-galactosidase
MMPTSPDGLRLIARIIALSAGLAHYVGRRALGWMAVASVLLAAAAPARDRPAPLADQPFVAAPLAVGAAWYPEQWPEEEWDADLTLMSEARLRVVRVGEFAWARMEPEDGKFDFAWLDRAIAAATRHGLKVVLGTPTAAPPIWLTEQHPDVRRVNADASVEGPGKRRQFSFASATYRRFAIRIAGEMARRYGHNPAVVGWQVDNEIGIPSFDADARAQWAAWLKQRYGTVDAMNQRWSTQYWSQVYRRFDQVPLTTDGKQNPGLVLDARRFQSAVWSSYVNDQARAIRAAADSRQFVTTNTTMWEDAFNPYEVHASLDIAAWDEYVPDGRPDWTMLALHHDVVRGYKNRNFWVMEAQPGWVNWADHNGTLAPGDTRLLAWQAVAHGADAILYWQWRSALNGQEQYHGTLLGPDGKPMPIYDEIRRTATELAAAAPILSGTVPSTEIALLYSPDSRWALEQQRFNNAYDPLKVLEEWYRPFARVGQTLDVLPPDADLSRYRLVVAPGLNVLPAAVADRLAAWVRAGGHLVLGPRSGMKDADNALWPQRQPGPLALALGAHVIQYIAPDGPVPVAGFGEADIWTESLEVTDPAVNVVARYGGGAWLSGLPAIVERRLGKGRITYVGALLGHQGQERLTLQWLKADGLLADDTIPEGLDVVARSGVGKQLMVVINHSGQSVTWRPAGDVDLLFSTAAANAVPGYGVAIYRRRAVRARD